MGSLLRFGRFTRQIPAIQISDASAQISCKPKPPEVWHHAVSGDLVNLAPKIRQIHIGADECHDVNQGSDGHLEPKEQGRPDKIQCQLRRIDCRGVTCATDELGRVQGRRARHPGAVGGVAHKPIQKCPGGAKKPGWWREGGLAEGPVCLLSLLA